MNIVGRAFLVLGGLAVCVPIALGVLAYGVATLNGCILSSGGVRSCVVFGTDIGSVLGSMLSLGMVFGMLGFIPGLILAGVGAGMISSSKSKKDIAAPVQAVEKT